MRAQAVDDGGVFAFRHETDVLAVRLVGHRQAQLRRNAAHGGLFQTAQGEAHEVELIGRGGEQEIGLVARGIDGAVQLRAAGRGLAAHIVARGHGFRAQVARGLQQIVELDRLVAAHTGDRRFAPQIGVGELLDHRFPEAAFVVEHIVRHADGLCGHAGVVDVLTGAAGAFFLDRRAMVVELQGHTDHVIAGPLEQGGGDRGIHASGHGHDHARAHRQADRQRGRLSGVKFSDIERHGKSPARCKRRI